MSQQNLSKMEEYQQKVGMLAGELGLLQFQVEEEMPSRMKEIKNELRQLSTKMKKESEKMQAEALAAHAVPNLKSVENNEASTTGETHAKP